MTAQYHDCMLLFCIFQISHGGLILLRNVKPEETEEIVEPVVGMYMYTSVFITMTR